MKILKPAFISASDLSARINGYFTYIEGEYQIGQKTSQDDAGLRGQKIWSRQPEPPTITGLAFYLGFDSRRAFEAYEVNGRFAAALRQGRLRIETEYEKKLHLPSPSGVIFALKCWGWGERNEDHPVDNVPLKSLIIRIVESGPQPVSSEKEVVL